MALISIRGLTKTYRMGDAHVHALDGVDLDIERGEFVAITGASGSGKSTLMHLLGCLDRPTRGAYILDGQNVSRMNEKQLAAVRNRSIGFVFQTFNLIQRTPAVDNVGVPLFYARKSSIRGPALHALERVGLRPRAHHRPNELSGGERQRVAIARAIVNDPVLLLADEPTGNLDSRTGEQIMEIFHELNAQGVTIVLVTHEADVALQAQRIVSMRDGRIISDRRVDPRERDELLARHRSALVMADAPSSGNGEPRAGEPRGGGRAPAGGKPDRVRGAVGALTLALLGAAGVLSGVVAGRLVGKLDIQPGQTLPAGVLWRAASAVLPLLVGYVLAIIALFVGRRARRLMRESPGLFRGAEYLLAGRVIAWLVILAPLLSALVSKLPS
ncbi:MAG: Vitamin B12 import ATP-binding protein BtuD [Phycisphaerae bacterium]|nr:Vitamin B12 import ATP-binding protein BtuD [Phycisphaerae bacterium]